MITLRKEDFDIRIFAKRFSNLLENSEENTHSLAKKLGLSPATISRYANGLMTPKLITLYAAADIFGVDPLWLMGFDVACAQQSNSKQINLPPPSITENILTEHENEVINAYRNKAEMQSAVDTLLGITQAEQKENEQTVRTMRVAAYGGGITEHKYTATDEEIQKAIEYDEDDDFVIKPKNK